MATKSGTSKKTELNTKGAKVPVESSKASKPDHKKASVTQAVAKPTKATPSKAPIKISASSPKAKSVAKVAPKPVAKVAPKPVAKVAPKPVAKVAPKPVAKVAPKPVAKVVPKPVAKVAPKPVAKVAPKPVAKVAPKPVAKVVPKPVAKVVPKPQAKTLPAKPSMIKPSLIEPSQEQAAHPMLGRTNAFNFTTELDFRRMKETIEKAKQSIIKTLLDAGDYSIEQKLVALYSLQLIDSEIDKIKIIRGELPLEVQDLEDEISALAVRRDRSAGAIEQLEQTLRELTEGIKESKAAIKRYENQQDKVKNNREYESLNKEIEFQHLEIQLKDKKIKEASIVREQRQLEMAELEKVQGEYEADLHAKRQELNEIIQETEREELELTKISAEYKQQIETRLIDSYERIRKNARNGLAVVPVERDACGGCFNKIPPQRQMEIKMHKKILVCEHCGRLLVDESIKEIVDQVQ